MFGREPDDRRKLPLVDRRSRERQKLVVDHLVFFAVKEDASPEEVDDLLSSIRGLKDEVPGTVDLSVGEDFSGRSGEYTHALFARFEDTAGLQEYMGHPAHLAVVEKLEATTTGRIVADYEF